jgi:hypothetical protein
MSSLAPILKHLAPTLALAAALTAPAQSPNSEEPKSYDCRHTPHALHIDGKLNERAWKNAPWTSDFVDIQGDIQGGSMPQPRFHTRMKMLWDDDYLYIGAELEEPDVKATLTKHDSVIFHDNDFELFLKPPVADPSYFEFEINALNTSWDLFLDKPYLDGGKPDSTWDIPGLKSAVAIHGTLNKSSDKDRGWTIEIAIPWTAFATRLPVVKPTPGTEWRANFSRVEWKAGQAREDNWVWTPQGVINMHVPEKWGHIHFLPQH